METTRFKVYRHSTRPHFRLVLPEGALFPNEEGAVESDWTFITTKSENEMTEREKSVVAERGYSLTKIGIEFREMEGSAPRK